ncbi:MAG: RND family transporter [Nitrospirota bacterium]
MKRIIDIITDHPKITISVIAIITIFFVSQLHRLRLETNIEEMLPKKDLAYINKKMLEKVFGVKDMVIIGVVNEGKDGIYNKGTLALIKRITDTLRDMEGINAITKDDLISISTLDNIIGTEEGMEVTPFMEDIPETREEIERLKDAVFSNDIYRGSIFSEDRTATVIMAELEDGVNPGEVYFRIKDYIDTERQRDIPEKIYIAGRPAIEGIFGIYMAQDNQRMMPLVIILIIAVLYITFRTIRGVLIPLTVVIIAVIWTLSTMGLLGIPIFTISNMMPVILIAIGTADGIHLLSKYYDEVIEFPDKTKKEIVMDTMSELSTPVIMTSLTTAVGFLSNITSKMIPIRYFGAFTALGTIYAMVFSLIFIPAVLMLLKKKVPERLRRNMETDRDMTKVGISSRILSSLSRFVCNRQKMITITTIAIVITCIYGLMSIYVDASLLSEFRETSEIRQADNILNTKFNGTTSLNIIIDADKDNAMKDPVLLKKIDNLQTYMESMDEVGDTLSIAEFIKRMNRVMNEDRKEMEVIPDSRDLIAQYLLMYSMSGDPEDFDDVVDYNYRQANIRAMLKTDHSRPVSTIIQRLKEFVKDNFDSKTNVKLAGTAYTTYTFVDIIIRGQTMGLIIGILGIFLLTSLEFRSFIAGIFNIIPITFSILFNFGMMGMIGFPLEVGTALTAGMAMGVGVDYAIHFISRYRLAAGKTDNPHDITLITMITSGKAIFFNAVVVIAGFLVLLRANLYPQVKLGIMVSLTMLICFLSSVIILPLLLNYFKPKFIFNESP